MKCDEAIKLFNLISEKYGKVYPAGSLLLCLSGKEVDVNDIDIVMDGITTMMKDRIDNTIVHIFPLSSVNKICYEECGDNYLAIYYCIKYYSLRYSVSK